jgi:dihydrofolate reductase
MGKVIISTHITVDGVIGPSPQDWAILEGEGERYKFDQLLAADAFLLGRKVYEGLASVWPTITDDTGFAERTNSIPKYVASRTLEEPLEWNASLIKGELAESVTGLKHQHRRNRSPSGAASSPTSSPRRDSPTRSTSGSTPRSGAAATGPFTAVRSGCA